MSEIPVPKEIATFFVNSLEEDLFLGATPHIDEIAVTNAISSITEKETVHDENNTIDLDPTIDSHEANSEES